MLRFASTASRQALRSVQGGSARALLHTANPEDNFDQSLRETKEFMEQPRFKNLKRVYTAQDVASLKGTVPMSYASDFTSKKLWALLEECQANKKYSATFGCLDPVMITQQVKYLSTIYVSGWQCSSTASTSNEPGPDLADYPMDTVPNKVDQLFRAQLFHDRKQREARIAMSAEERANTPAIDYMRPIIADGDTGHGGLTAVMRLIKMMVERGASGIHLEDQKPGAKKCGHMGGKVLVATQEHIDRMCAARLQMDIMGSTNLIVCRTDSEAATLIDSNMDGRDHHFIKGSTNVALGSLGSQLNKAAGRGASAAEISEITAEWNENAGLMTYYNAVKNAIEESGSRPDKEQVLAAWASRAMYKSNEEARAVAKELGFEVSWDWDMPRTREGYYILDPSVEQGIRRGMAFSPYADLLWMETPTPNISVAAKFAEGVKSVHPHTKLAYNLSPSFNWDGAGLFKSDADIASFQNELGDLGFVWQFITLAGLHATALITDRFSKGFSSQDHMLAYVRDIQREERADGNDVLMHQKWSGAALVDKQLSLATGGTSSTLAMGSGVTEAQFAAKRA